MIKIIRNLARPYRYAILTFLALQLLYILAVVFFSLSKGGSIGETIIGIILYWPYAVILSLSLSLPTVFIGLIITKIKKEKITMDQIILTLIFSLGFLYVIYFVIVYTPQIGGRVIDAETGKPIPYARIETKWDTDAFIPDVSYDLNPLPTIKADKDGKFVIPRVLRINPSSLNDQWIFIYQHGYNYLGARRYPGLFFRELEIYSNPKASDAISDISPSHTTIKLLPLKTDDEWRKNWNGLESKLNSDRLPSFKANIKFLVEDTEMFVKRFPNSPLAPDVMMKAADIYSSQIYQIKQGRSIFNKKYARLAIKQLRRIVAKFPGTQQAEQAEYSANEDQKKLDNHLKGVSDEQ